jgi:hypothetical protein
MDSAERERREAVFAGAKAAVLGCRPVMATDVAVVRMDSDEYVLRFKSGAADAALGVFEGQFLECVDGSRTVGEIIEAIADDLEMSLAMQAGKAAMAALHVHYVDGVIEELRGLRTED